jgi:hypothetical protein
MQSPENDSPGEVEDTPGDATEDVAEVADGTSEDMSADSTTSTETSDG